MHKNKLKIGAIRKRMKIKKAKAKEGLDSRASVQWGSLGREGGGDLGRGFGVFDFIGDRKNIVTFKGVPNPKRKQRAFTFVTGDKRRRAGLYVQRGRGGTLLVFRTIQKGGERKMISQKTAGLGYILNRPKTGVQQKIFAFAEKTLPAVGNAEISAAIHKFNNK